jgi:hypothetical protein
MSFSLARVRAGAEVGASPRLAFPVQETHEQVNTFTYQKENRPAANGRRVGTSPGFARSVSRYRCLDSEAEGARSHSPRGHPPPGRDRAEGEKRESIMVKKVINRRWSYVDDRRLIQLAASSKSVNAIADEMNRPPERVVQMALRLGIFLKSAAKQKPNQTSQPRPALRPWTADEQEKLDDLLRAGKDAGEIATALRRTRQAIYLRLRRMGAKPMRSWRLVDRG